MSRIYAQHKRRPSVSDAPTHKASVPMPSMPMGGLGEALEAGMLAKYRQHFQENQIPSAEAEADRIAASVSGAKTPDEVKAQLGEKMGADFSGVRFLTDAASARQADTMGALAYTTGSEVRFGSGGFDPSIAAHELVHTVQQGAVSSTMSTLSAPAGGVQMASPTTNAKVFGNPKFKHGKFLAAGDYEQNFAHLSPDELLEELMKLKAYLSRFRITGNDDLLPDSEFDAKKLSDTYNSVLQQASADPAFIKSLLSRSQQTFKEMHELNDRVKAGKADVLAQAEAHTDSDEFYDEAAAKFEQNAKYKALKEQYSQGAMSKKDFKASRNELGEQFLNSMISNRKKDITGMFNDRVLMQQVNTSTAFRDTNTLDEMLTDLNQFGLSGEGRELFLKGTGHHLQNTQEGIDFSDLRERAMVYHDEMNDTASLAKGYQRAVFKQMDDGEITGYSLPTFSGGKEAKENKKRWNARRKRRDKVEKRLLEMQHANEKQREHSKLSMQEQRNRIIARKEKERVLLAEDSYRVKPDYNSYKTLEELEAIDVSSLPVSQHGRQPDGMKLKDAKRSGSSRFFHRQFFGAHKKRKQFTAPQEETASYKSHEISVPIGGNAENTLKGYKYTPNGLKPGAIGKDPASITDEDRVTPNGQSVILFSGTGGDNFGQMQNMITEYTNKGYTVYGVDYRGFGQNDRGKDFNVSEYSLNRDAHSIYDYVTGENGEGANPNNVLLHGFSMGGAVASRLASDISKSAKGDDSKKLGGLVLHSAMKDLKSAASETVGTGSIARWAGRKSEKEMGSFSTLDALTDIAYHDKSMPVYAISGGADDKLALERTKLHNHATAAGLTNVYSQQGSGGHLVDGAAPAGHMHNSFISKKLRNGLRRIFGGRNR